MNSYPSPDEILDELGDKIIEALSRAVARTTVDLVDYRDVRPQYVSQSSERGLANWIHDRLWYHMTALLDQFRHVELRESGVTREIMVGINYRLRVKRHTLDGHVSTYATETAMDFMDQETLQMPLPGLGEIRLIVGYAWDAEVRNMVGGVLSLRDGLDKVIWLVDLPDVGTGLDDRGAPVVVPPTSGPKPPTIDLADESDERSEAGEDSSE